MGEPIRVLHILQRMEAGGTQALLMNIYRKIDRTKVQFDFLVVYKEKQFYDDEIEKMGGHIYKLSFREDLNLQKFQKELADFFAQHHEYKIVHCHAYTIGYFCLKAAKKAGIPVRIAHSHNNETVHDIKYLQAYSLKKMIESLGNEVRFLAIEKGTDDALSIQCEKKDIDKKNDSWLETQWNRVKGKILGRNLRRVFYEFRNSTGLNSVNGDEHFDTCVIGSDEVFNCLQKSKWGFSSQLFGKVEAAERVITYAASCGSTKVDDLSDELREAIKSAMSNLSVVSVRDKNTADFVEKISEKKPVYNLDPVAVGNFDDEIRNVTVNSKLPKKYCIVYSYAERFSDPEEIKAISEYCKKYNLKIVAPFGRQKWIPSYETLTPFELLKAFQNAECIVTDTFHGTLFGAKFGKRMAVLIRESNQNKLEDLTQRLQIQSHVITDISQLDTVLKKELEKKKMGEILGLEREKSLKYLKENL